MNKTYITHWKNGEKAFDDVVQAIKFAEEKGETEGIYVCVYKEVDGVRAEEPFFYCSCGL